MRKALHKENPHPGMEKALPPTVDQFIINFYRQEVLKRGRFRSGRGTDSCSLLTTLDKERKFVYRNINVNSEAGYIMVP